MNQIECFIVNFKVCFTKNHVFFEDISIFDIHSNITEYYKFNNPFSNNSFSHFNIIRDFLKKKNIIIFVKGEFRYHYLKLFSAALVVNLDDLGCPSTNKLEKFYLNKTNNNTLNKLQHIKAWFCTNVI